MKASIIIANLNGKDFIARCLDSLRQQVLKDFEVIVVDNGSTDGSAKFIKDNYREVRILENSQNRGFAAGNNDGIKIAKGEYIVVLNNDTFLDKAWLSNLIKAADSDKSIGMVAAKIILASDMSSVDSMGVLIYPDGMSKQKRFLGKNEVVLLPSGCCALYKRSMLDEIGLFDEDFFAYCEDTDLGLRGQWAGWKAVVAQDALCYHLYSGTSSKYPFLKAFLVERNHQWVAIKNFPFFMILTLPLYTIYRYALNGYAILAQKGKSGRFAKDYSAVKLFVILIKANLAALSKMPVMLKKRKYIMNTRKVRAGEFCSLLGRHTITGRELVISE